jgi:hypothetical protein
LLNDQAFAILAMNFPKSVISLNLSKNENLTISTYRQLASFNLRFLYLESNGLTDDDLRALIEVEQDMQWKPTRLFKGH